MRPEAALVQPLGIKILALLSALPEAERLEKNVQQICAAVSPPIDEEDEGGAEACDDEILVARHAAWDG